jgi:hypothetical protein
MIDFSTAYELPDIIDLDGDLVAISLNLDNGISFVSFNPTNHPTYNTGTITISPYRFNDITPGNYTAVFDLNDTKEITKINLSIEVYSNNRP